MVPKIRIKVVAVAASVILLLIVAAFFLTGMGVIKEPPIAYYMAGKPAPNLLLATLEQPDHTVQLSSLLHKVTVITIWASWCEKCADRIRELALLKDKYKSDINLIGIAYKDKPEDARRWMRSMKDPFAVNLYDPDGKFAAEYLLLGIPDSVLIDEQGKVVELSFDVTLSVDKYMESTRARNGTAPPIQD